MNSGQCELLDHPRTINQIVNLERHTSRAGKDQITNPPNAHDDLANVVAGVFCAGKRLKTAGVWKWESKVRPARSAGISGLWPGAVKGSITIRDHASGESFQIK